MESVEETPCQRAQMLFNQYDLEGNGFIQVFIYFKSECINTVLVFSHCCFQPEYLRDILVGLRFDSSPSYVDSLARSEFS